MVCRGKEGESDGKEKPRSKRPLLLCVSIGGIRPLGFGINGSRADSNSKVGSRNEYVIEAG